MEAKVEAKKSLHPATATPARQAAGAEGPRWGPAKGKLGLPATATPARQAAGAEGPRWGPAKGKLGPPATATPAETETR